MKRVEFVVPGTPRPWKRTGGNGKVRYDTTPQKKRKATIKRLAIKAMREAGLEVIDGPVRLTVICVFPRPDKRIAYKQRGKRKIRYERCSLATWEGGDRFLMWVTPDWDNCGKLPSDCIDTDKGSTMYGPVLFDDGQAAIGHVEKWYAAEDEAPHTRVVIETLDT